MELRWTEEAANDLERITDYLFEKSPERAPDLVRAIYNVWQRREHKLARSLFLAQAPSLVVYRITSDAIQIARILHGAQKWP